MPEKPVTSLAVRLRTTARLGIGNIARVAAYRLGLKLGCHSAQKVQATLPIAGPFFSYQSLPAHKLNVPRQWRSEALLFGAHPVPIGDSPPSWLDDPLDNTKGSHQPQLPMSSWWSIDEFAGGDIKRIWELSRFDWVVAFAQQIAAGDAGAAKRLESWVADWACANPAYRGPNWKCAQEAAIRLMHLSVAAIVLGEQRVISSALQTLVDAHVRRIVPTLSYALAQDNNHATSEAAALFITGAWYQMAGVPGGAALERRGRALLERSVARLFAADGSFSQHSLNYHRFALDTLSLAEVWRRLAGLSGFSPTLLDRAAAAAEWLRVMVDPASGDAPNLGANDGANLLPLTDAAYRDYRPSVQLASVLFANARAYPDGPWNDLLRWFGLRLPDTLQSLPSQRIFDDGGYAVIRRGATMALLRYPRFRFRPSQADVLHLDLWHNGVNLLRDGGSYSYNTQDHWIAYFGGAASHNTIVFDGAPQMPRLSRFLLGDWLETEHCGAIGGGFEAAYRHRAGWRHHRAVTLLDTLRVTDIVSGFANEARLRWRLTPGNWRIEGETVTNGNDSLSVTADAPLAMQLVEGWESRHYLEKTSLPVLEVVVGRAAQIVSEYRWSR